MHLVHLQIQEQGQDVNWTSQTFSYMVSMQQTSFSYLNYLKKYVHSYLTSGLHVKYLHKGHRKTLHSLPQSC
jgi:hypothetical protein